MIVEQPVKILLVDDEPNILKSIQRILIDEEYELLTADCGEDALEILRTHKDLALIISDQRMPGMSGIELLAQSREIAPTAYRILLTGYADIEAVIDSINKSAVSRFILKPWENDMLLDAVNDTISHYLLNCENKRLNNLVAQQNQELQSWNSTLESRVKEQTQEIMLANTKLTEANTHLLKSFNSSLEVFSSLMDLRDPLISNHSKNVAAVSYLMAHKHGVSQENSITAKVAALLHDIGKVGITDAVLQKQKENYTDLEYAEYKKHSVRGQMAIDSIEELRNAGILIRHHHEKFNGTGFPDGLKGDEIPIGARIICLADYIDNKIWTLDPKTAVSVTLDLIRNELGRSFDPELFDAAAYAIRKYYSILFLEKNITEIAVDIGRLRNGMVLSRDLRTGTGILLEARGAVLDSHSIASIRRYATIDPSGHNNVFIKKN